MKWVKLFSRFFKNIVSSSSWRICLICCFPHTNRYFSQVCDSATEGGAPYEPGKRNVISAAGQNIFLPLKLERPTGICVIFLSIKKSFLAVIACGRRIYKQFDQQLLTQCPNSRHRSVRQPKNNIILEHRGRNTSPPKWTQQVKGHSYSGFLT